MNVWNIVSTDGVHASSVGMSNIRIYKYIVNATLYKPVTYLSAPI